MALDIKEKYINPYTDFGFKKLFGTEMNKDLLISFLNALFMGHQNIKEVKYLPTEHFGVYGDSRRAIFDVYCEDENGGKFIVEMQNVYQQFFKPAILQRSQRVLFHISYSGTSKGWRRMGLQPEGGLYRWCAEL